MRFTRARLFVLLSSWTGPRGTGLVEAPSPRSAEDRRAGRLRGQNPPTFLGLGGFHCTTLGSAGKASMRRLPSEHGLFFAAYLPGCSRQVAGRCPIVYPPPRGLDTVHNMRSENGSGAGTSLMSGREGDSPSAVQALDSVPGMRGLPEPLARFIVSSPTGPLPGGGGSIIDLTHRHGARVSQTP